MKNLLKILSLVVLYSIIFISCKKETSLTIDTVAPKVTFRIQGNGNDNSFEAIGRDSSPNGEYVFKPNTRYTFTVSITDTSGMGQLIFKMTKGAVIQEFTLNGAPAATEVENLDDYQYSIITASTDPYKSFLMSGNFLTGTSGDGELIRFSIQGRDYRPNQTNLYLNGSLYAQPPAGIFGWNQF